MCVCCLFLSSSEVFFLLTFWTFLLCWPVTSNVYKLQQQLKFVSTKKSLCYVILRLSLRSYVRNSLKSLFQLAAVVFDVVKINQSKVIASKVLENNYWCPDMTWCSRLIIG